MYPSVSLLSLNPQTDSVCLNDWWSGMWGKGARGGKRGNVKVGKGQ